MGRSSGETPGSAFATATTELAVAKSFLVKFADSNCLFQFTALRLGQMEMHMHICMRVCK